MSNFSIKNLQNLIVKYSPEILLSLGISGLCFSVIYSVKATLKSKEKIDEYKRQTKKEKITTKEIIKCSWKEFLPVIISTGVSVPCLIYSNSIYHKRNTIIAAACALSETALKEYQQTVKEVVGDQKEKVITEKLSQKEVKETYEPNKTQVILTGDGDSLFFEPLTSRYFKSNWNKVLRSANYLNSRALTDFYGAITLNDWFDELGLDRTDLGNELGWEISSGPNGLLDVSLNSSLTPDGVPCGSIYYTNRPIIIS